MVWSIHYSRNYIDNSRRRIQSQLRVFQGLNNPSREFEIEYFRNLVVMLQASFQHRSRQFEGSDGNPLNEVRMLSESILANSSILEIDKTIEYEPSHSVLGLPIGSDICPSEAEFERLSEAFFEELTRRYAA